MSEATAAVIRVLLAVVFLTCAIIGMTTGEKAFSLIAIAGGLSVLAWSWRSVGRHV